jgi:dihydrofolate reductase
MRTVIEYVLASADGVIEDPVGMGVAEYQDDAYLRDGLGLLTACDAILFGRATYEAFAELYDGRTDHKPMWADRLATMPKYVFSSTLARADWTTLSSFGATPSPKWTVSNNRTAAACCFWATVGSGRACCGKG